MWRQIKSGAWLTSERLRHYPLILIGIAMIAAVAWIALSDGLIDRNGKPIGTDFSNVWAAGNLVLAGEPAGPYDLARQAGAERDAFGGRPVPIFGWHYPPLFLFVAAGLALLPYGWALAVWLGLTLPAYLITLRSILPRMETLLVGLAFPAVFVNIGHGQNGFLTAALLGGGLRLLDERPWLAGVLIGLLAYKPQFAVLAPLALLASGRWRAICACAATVIAACAASVAAFGAQTWHAFASSTAFTRTVVLEQGNIGWAKIQSIFSAVRMCGGSIDAAYAAQIALGTGVAASLLWLWRSRAAYELKAAALACGCLLATPYLLDYDLVVLAIAIAFFVRHALVGGFHDYEISVLSLCWIAPLFARTIAGVATIPLGLISMLALYGLTLHRAMLDLPAKTIKDEFVNLKARVT